MPIFKNDIDLIPITPQHANHHQNIPTTSFKVTNKSLHTRLTIDSENTFIL